MRNLKSKSPTGSGSPSAVSCQSTAREDALLAIGVGTVLDGVDSVYCAEKVAV